MSMNYFVDDYLRTCKLEYKIDSQTTNNLFMNLEQLMMRKFDFSTGLYSDFDFDHMNNIEDNLNGFFDKN